MNYMDISIIVFGLMAIIRIGYHYTYAEYSILWKTKPVLLVALFEFILYAILFYLEHYKFLIGINAFIAILFLWNIREIEEHF